MTRSIHFLSRTAISGFVGAAAIVASWAGVARARSSHVNLATGNNVWHGRSAPVLRTATTHPMQYYLSLPADWAPGKKWPVVLTIEGSGREWHQNAVEFALVRDRMRYPFIVVTPIVLTNVGVVARDAAAYSYGANAWSLVDSIGRCAFDMTGVEAVLADVRAEYGGEAKMYLAGFSGGGHLAWPLIFAHPDEWAATAIAGGNWNGRCVESEVAKPFVFSSAPDRVRLPVKVLEGANDPAVARNGAQGEQALAVAREHGFTNLSRDMVPNAGHERMPGPVLAFFADVARRR